MTDIVISNNGAKWVASQGDRHVEGDDPEDALCNLSAINEFGDDAIDDLNLQDQLFYNIQNADKRILRLIKLLTMQAPATVLRNEVDMIRNSVEAIIATREELE